MKKVLIYKNRKIDPLVWDASTPELEAEAFLALFDYLDNSWKVYDNLKENPQPDLMRGNQFALYNAAKAGHIRACRELLSKRMHNDYEFWQLLPVEGARRQ